MALDFTTLNDDGTPSKVISISVKVHAELIEAAQTMGLDRLLTFADYYEDAEVPVNRMQPLLGDVQALLRQELPPDLTHFLHAFEALIELALTAESSIHAIAD